MDSKLLIDGLILYLGLLVLLTLHEFGHAWTAWKCGDDTAKLQGRVSLNPIVHIDLFGTVILPLMMILLSPGGGMMFGWAKPVPVNTQNLRRPKFDDLLVTLAGPGMNLLLAVVLMGLGRAGMLAPTPSVTALCVDMAQLSLVLCFFNLLPVPPLDGSQVLRILTGMSYETYYQISRYSIFILIIVMQLPLVQRILAIATGHTTAVLANWFGVAVSVV